MGVSRGFAGGGSGDSRCTDGRAGNLGSLRRFARNYGADGHLRSSSKPEAAVW